MGVTAFAAEATEALPAAETADVSSVITLIKTSVSGVFEIAGSAFSFLISNPLAAFMVGTGFAFTALGVVRKGLKTAKRS